MEKKSLSNRIVKDANYGIEAQCLCKTGNFTACRCLGES